MPLSPCVYKYDSAVFISMIHSGVNVIGQALWYPRLLEAQRCTLSNQQSYRTWSEAVSGLISLLYQGLLIALISLSVTLIDAEHDLLFYQGLAFVNLIM